MKRNISLQISGRVHGVSFRVSAKREADRLGVAGYVMNCDDGSVWVEAEGESEALDQLAKWCHDGPDLAEVRHVASQDGTIIGYTGFEIRR